MFVVLFYLFIFYFRRFLNQSFAINHFADISLKAS